MNNDIVVTSGAPAGAAVPIALYESSGIVFELYNGGRSYQPHGLICWEQLKTFTVAREGDFTFLVRVSRAHSGKKAERLIGIRPGDFIPQFKFSVWR